MRSLHVLGFAALVFSPSCTSNDSGFEYGRSHPGVDLPEGGGVYHDNIRGLGQPAQALVTVYQYTAPTTVDSAPFAWPLLPASFEASPNTQPAWGNCVDERGAQTWPYSALDGVSFYMLSQVALTGPGITGTLDLPDGSPGGDFGRDAAVAYGTPTLGNGFAPTIAMATPDADYTLDIGEGDAMTYHMPAAYVPPLGIGGADTVAIAAGHDLEMTWTAPPNDKGPDGTVHGHDTYFNFTLFVDPTATHETQFICFDDVDGHQLIPAAVLAQLPATGLIIQADYSHYMEARSPADGRSASGNGSDRRFDLYSSYTSYSSYAIQ
jgi:hypothetical protein